LKSHGTHTNTKTLHRIFIVYSVPSIEVSEYECANLRRKWNPDVASH